MMPTVKIKKKNGNDHDHQTHLNYSFTVFSGSFVLIFSHTIPKKNLLILSNIIMGKKNGN